MTESEPRPLIDVIVPVHGAGPVFRRCAASLIAHADAFRADARAVDALAADAFTADAIAANAIKTDAIDGETDSLAADAARREAARGARHRLVIVLDGPPDAESVLAVEELRAAAAREVGRFELSVLTHETRLGFVLSVNHALRGSDRDAVLLNSDTQVTAGWLGRLQAAAYSDPKVATVTPFSNNATICSLPRFLDENAIPAGCTIESFGALVTRVSVREYPRLPTGVGFCLYLKRSVLDEVGPFDEAFGLGYGEEVDLCLRAASRGYVHVLDDATFIFHEGSRSFGQHREQRMRRGERLVLSRYPDYLRNVAEFIKRDPIASARARVLDELRRTEATSGGDLASADVSETASTPARPNRAPGAPAWLSGQRPVSNDLPGAGSRLARAAGPIDIGTSVAARSATAGWPERVLHLVPGWPPWTSGEAAMAVRGLIRDQSARREVFVYARMADPDRGDGSALEYVDGGIRVRLIVANSTPRTVFSRIGAGVRSDPVGEDFARFLDEVRPHVVHAHDLDGQSLDLLGAARVRTIRAALRSVEAFVMGSRSIADRYADARLLPRSAHVAVSPIALNGCREAQEEVERVYAEVKNPRAQR